MSCHVAGTDVCDPVMRFSEEPRTGSDLDSRELIGGMSARSVTPARLESSPSSAPGRRDRAVFSSVVALVGQLALVGIAALLYFGVRGLTEGSATNAVAHAHRVVGLERALGIDVEDTLQAAVIEHDWIVALANWVYIWGHWPVIVASLIWLHRRNVGSYEVLRNALFVSGAIGLVIFTLYPVAPPRLAGMGLVDTVTVHSNSYRVLQPPSLVNKYAALPSLHVGWNFLVGVALWRQAGSRRWRWAAALSPALMFSAVVLTANHYIVDGLLGIVVVLAGLTVADWHHARSQPSGHADNTRARRSRAQSRPGRLLVGVGTRTAIVGHSAHRTCRLRRQRAAARQASQHGGPTSASGRRDRFGSEPRTGASVGATPAVAAPVSPGHPQARTGRLAPYEFDHQ